MVGITKENFTLMKPKKVETGELNDEILDPTNSSPASWTRSICLTFAIIIFFMLMPQLLRCSYFIRSTPNVVVLGYDSASSKVLWPDPPSHKEPARVARYTMHISEWCSLATISTHPGLEKFPFVNVFSVSDGPMGNSTGVPYFYFTPLELSSKDIKVNNNVSMTVSLAQSDFCNQKGYDPEDPRCAHVIFSGTIQEVQKGSEEERFAKLALFSRHHEMAQWPQDHAWFFAKLNIIHIYVLDWFGGVAVVTPEEYFGSSPIVTK